MQANNVSTSVTTPDKTELDDEQCLSKQFMHTQVLEMYASTIFFPNIKLIFSSQFTLFFQ